MERDEKTNVGSVERRQIHATPIAQAVRRECHRMSQQPMVKFPTPKKFWSAERLFWFASVALATGTAIFLWVSLFLLPLVR